MFWAAINFWYFFLIFHILMSHFTIILPTILYFYCLCFVCTVHAVNIQTVCPFSLGSLVAYGPHERSHYHAHAPPAKQAAPVKHTVVGGQSAWQSGVAASGQAGNPESFCDHTDMIPQLEPRQRLAGQQMDTAVEPTWHSHVPGQLWHYFSV